MISDTQKFFIKILESYFSDEKIMPPPCVDFSAIAEISKKHEVASLVYSIAKNSNIIPLMEALQEHFAASAYHSINNMYEHEKVMRGLLDVGVKVIPIKGIVLQQYYKNEIDRSMGDIDILIDVGDVEKIKLVFTNLCYHLKKNSVEELKYVKSGTIYELHDRLIHTTYAVDDELQQMFFNDFWKYTEDTLEGNLLNWNVHLLFLFNHLGKHLRIEGAGFRQFLDIAVMIHFHNDLCDWKWIIEKAKKIHIYDFMITVLAFCKRWFEISIPIEVPDIGVEFYEYATEMILENGVFGYGNEDNGLADIEKNSHRYPMWISRVFSIKQIVFPSYNNLVTSSKYDELKGKPWKLPIVWIKRGWNALKWNKKGIETVKRMIVVDSTVIEKRKNYLNHWGL